ncbi:hypothetical protein [Actinomycetospora sp. NBRC 106375]|uniref:hypothetical protein n=1 Tax=Actinomycetospora sp. NBRC 106375 TaxID=3032207 RepID=UPI002556D1C8|nr:hypothetical protein [Actinomycetospora sp. NBRC 106375]
MRADLPGDVLEAYAGVRAGAVVEPSFVLDPFAMREVGGGVDMLLARPSGLDTRGRLEHHPTPDRDAIVPVLRIGDLAVLLAGAGGRVAGARLEAEGFLYASHFPWDGYHGVRVPGTSRRWRVDRVQRRDIVGADTAELRVVRTVLDDVPPGTEVDDRAVVELVLRRP